MIPAFPEFKPIELADKEPLDRYLTAHPPLASEYTFTNLFAWQQAGQYHLARYGDGFLIRKDMHGMLSFLQPLVTDRKVEAVMDGLTYLDGKTSLPTIERVDEVFLRGLPLANLVIREERDQFDYLYSVQELIELPGERFHDKKNLLAQFQKKYRYRYLPLCANQLPDCLSFAHEWCVERHCEKSDSLTRENCAVVQILTHYLHLNVIGGALEVNGELAAFTLGERLNRDTMVIHVEKAKAGITGVYQAINREFLHHAAGEYTYVNREQDLGVDGLRKAKLSYNPVRLINKYCISPA